jgi:hypothetical protein
MWEKVYQSNSCCESSADQTSETQSLTVPQVQIAGRPIASRTAAWIAGKKRVRGAHRFMPAS